MDLEDGDTYHAQKDTLACQHISVLLSRALGTVRFEGWAIWLILR